MASIYCIENRINKKCYIGQTWLKVRNRIHSHNTQNNSNSILYKAFRKYGLHNFDIWELHTDIMSQKELDYLEDFWIRAFRTRHYGYNIREGGSRGRLSEQTKQKLSKARMGTPCPEASKIATSLRTKGIPKSEETKQRISEARKGIKYSEETIAKMRIAAKLRIQNRERNTNGTFA